MSEQLAPRSTADARRVTVLAGAVRVFARNGYYATPVTEVAAAAGISPAYVFRLFGDKLGLFVAAYDHAVEQVLSALADGADGVGNDPDEVLDAMGGAYAALIADRDLMGIQVQALSAADIPEIGQAVRRGYQRVVTFAQDRSGASPHAVQHFIALGQLCHLIVAAGLGDVDASWARTLTQGIRHPAPESVTQGAA